MRTQTRALLALALAALLVTSSVGAVAVGGSSLSALNGTQEQDDLESADEIYVEDDGDAVLVYREDTSGTGTGHYGADLSEGLFHVFLNDTMDEAPEDNFSGEASFELTPESMTGDGAFSMDTPDSVEDLSFEASGEQTRENAQGSVSLDGTFTSESGTASTGTSMVESVSTEGSMTTTGSTFSTDGSVSATFSEDPGMDEMHFAFTLEEREDSYVLSGEQDYVVGSYSADSWNTRESARRSLEAQFGVVARQLDGEVSVTVDSHSFDSDTNRVDMSYTVEFTGVDEAVSEQLTTALASSQQMDLSESEAEDLAQRLQSVELTELSTTVDVTSEEASASWSVQIDNYDEASLAMLDIAEASEMNSSQMNLEDTRARIEAQQAADLTQEYTWNGSVSSPDQSTAEVQFAADYRTENWGSYVEELESRGVEWSGDTEFSASARTENGELTAEMSATFSQEELVSGAIDSMLQSSEGTGSDQSRAMLEAFQQSEFETAKMDVSMEDRTVSFEAGASFDNVSAFRDVMQDEYGKDLSVESAYGELTGDESVTYVRLSGAVSGDASESDVRELAVVGDETDVHMPGDWDPDEKDFPEMDTQEARNYLSVDDDGGGLLGGMPGFGPAVALVALVALALFGRRRAE
ncbi:PGF-CTERM sorting domain-containing protein [Haloarchaeobius iranensis]|uniref:PGF-CTERM protein n=1 Tax=Haloarchaeobius iranensis TaxID=996166 RepID=A0A1G9ZTJ8_9EURY|nr:PGF-CTERM sorting domain-containing protein [Haloarchaeobius iranensis]SDN23856.1 PGF-CTERM protein [Haloarchaeobius iranensis]